MEAVGGVYPAESRSIGDAKCFLKVCKARHGAERRNSRQAVKCSKARHGAERRGRRQDFENL